jgi:hypothetical protein
LLGCTFADESVIKDVDAVRHIGKKVEVHGVVVSVITSPFGTTFINFGRDYPNRYSGFGQSIIAQFSKLFETVADAAGL